MTVCVEIDAGARLAANSTDTSTHFVRKHGQARRFRSVPELSEEDSLDANDPLVLQSVVRHNSLPDSRDLDRLQWREAFVSSGSHSYFSTSAINVRRRASFSAQLECFPAIESRTGGILRSGPGTEGHKLKNEALEQLSRGKAILRAMRRKSISSIADAQLRYDRLKQETPKLGRNSLSEKEREIRCERKIEELMQPPLDIANGVAVIRTYLARTLGLAVMVCRRSTQRPAKSQVQQVCAERKATTVEAAEEPSMLGSSLASLPRALNSIDVAMSSTGSPDKKSNSPWRNTSPRRFSLPNAPSSPVPRKSNRGYPLSPQPRTRSPGGKTGPATPTRIIRESSMTLSLGARQMSDGRRGSLTGLEVQHLSQSIRGRVQHSAASP